MDFFEKTEYTENDLRYLIETQAEESTYLDFKAAGALEKTNEKRAEIAKDVSAFANSDGGIIIYGINEENHVASNFSFIDGNEYTKEWIERVINDGIQRRITGIHIFPIRVNGDIKQTVYVVKIPRSANSPHMCVKRHVYYRRYNFESVPMEEYEVRDSFHRNTTPDLRIQDCHFYKTGEEDNYSHYDLFVSIINNGQCACGEYKINIYLNDFKYCNFHSHNINPTEKLSPTIFDMSRLKFSFPAKETLFQQEQLDVGHFCIEILKDKEEHFFNHLIIDMILFFPGGTEEIAYVPSKDKYIKGREEINKLLYEMNLNDNVETGTT